MALIAAIVPPGDADQIAKIRFVDSVTSLLAARYGRWVCGWRWHGDGGVVTSWCCAYHSVGEPEATAAGVVASLLEWRDWLEDLAERFEWLAPPADADAEDYSWHVERAAARLVTLVVDDTGASGGWYGLCHTVLGWFLSFVGLEHDEAKRLVDATIGGRFESWVEPKPALIGTVGEELAARATGLRPHRDH
ncbi:hypothetical protein [Streptomyces sp. NPDC048560]|uniref:hypothetical protein n=1 Tax=Streptomyces sp. NPDC048560 TaxID=3155488 RepID=UPI00342767D3